MKLMITAVAMLSSVCTYAADCTVTVDPSTPVQIIEAVAKKGLTPTFEETGRYRLVYQEKIWETACCYSEGTEAFLSFYEKIAFDKTDSIIYEFINKTGGFPFNPGRNQRSDNKARKTAVELITEAKVICP